MQGISLRRLAWGLALFAGCALPDYTKVDIDGSPVGSDDGGDDGASDGSGAGDDGGSGDGPETGTCCGAEACDQPEVLDCVCATDSFCCEEGWDSNCAAEVDEFGCGSCDGGSSGSGGGSSGGGSGGTCGETTCDDSAPVCADGACVQCVDDNDCADHFPDYPVCIEGDCGECVQDSDCDSKYTGEFPYCIGGLCAECKEDVDCNGGTCVDAACE